MADYSVKIASYNLSSIGVTIKNAPEYRILARMEATQTRPADGHGLGLYLCAFIGAER